MAGTINKVILIGHLGNDPEIRALEGGVTLARLSVATSESYLDKSTGSRITNTEWHRVVLWRGLASIAEKYLKKGDLVYIEGKIKTRSYEDENNIKHYTTEVIANEMTMLGRRHERDSNQKTPEVSAPSDTDKLANEKKPQSPIVSNEVPEDDLPF